MEGSESGALVPSDPIMEVETWVKLSNFPAEFLTAEAISLIVSSFGSPVAADEDTFEKVENHKRPPKLRRKLHSRKTFVSIWVSVSVTKPLPSRLTVECPKGREYFIRLDFDPTPKVCLLCLGAGHFDFECCGTDKESEEIIAEAGVGFDGFCADFHGEQGAATTDGFHSYEDSTVVEAALMVDSHILSAASCDIGAAAAPELLPLLPASDYGVQGTLISEGSGSFKDSGEFHKWRDFTDDQGLSEADSGTEVGILGVELRDVGSLSGIGAFCDGVHGAVIFDRPECHDLSPVVEAELAEDLHFEQVASVVYCPKKHQKWRDKSDVMGLFCSQLQGMADPYMIDVQTSSGVNRAKKHLLWCELFDGQGLFSVEQLLSVVNCLRKHHIWRDKSVVFGLWCDNLDEQGMFSFEKLDLLQMLSRLVWILAATYYEQLLLDLLVCCLVAFDESDHDWLVYCFRYEGLLFRSGHRHGASNDT